MAEIMLKGFQCERCNHKWVPRENEVPRVCPKCKSPYWNAPRKIGIKKEFNIKEKKRLK